MSWSTTFSEYVAPLIVSVSYTSSQPLKAPFSHPFASSGIPTVLYNVSINGHVVEISE